MVTPEGVDLQVELADVGARAGALLLDGLIIAGSMIAATLVCVGLLFAAAAGGAVEKAFSFVGAAWLTVAFVLRNLYFTLFEMTPKGATPGKRIIGLRVAARNGGRLTADAIFARNAMRELELYLPLSFLLVEGRNLDAWSNLAGLIWCGVFVLFPLFNRDRLRVGDLAAGTWVVRAPRRKLAPDLSYDAGAGHARFAFTTAQLDAYGGKELQVLEGVLRRYERKTLTAVAGRIRDKIGWTAGPDESDGEFLGAYYAALRGRLESRLLLGRRRLDKHDKG